VVYFLRITLHYNEFIHERHDHFHIHKMTTFILYKLYSQYQTLRTLSFAQLRPSHLAPCLEIRCYLVVIQHMKREDYSSLVYRLLLITILEQFLFMTFLITAE
jgi:hypothetical protein